MYDTTRLYSIAMLCAFTARALILSSVVRELTPVIIRVEFSTEGGAISFSFPDLLCLINHLSRCDLPLDESF